MRILYVSDNSSVHNRRFLTKLACSGGEVFFLDICNQPMVPGWLPAGVDLTMTKALGARNPTEVRRMVGEFAGIVEKIQPDLVHAGPVQTAGYLAALSGFHPLVITSWGSDLLLDADRDSTFREATATALGAADGFFCDCDAVHKKAKSIVNISDSRIAQFPWGVERDRFSQVGPEVSREALHFDSGAFVFLCTRAWEPLYGIDTLLEAFRRAHFVNSALRLILLGGGSQGNAVRDFIGKHDLGGAIRTPGAVAEDDLPLWLRSADAYISCTYCDGTSVSLLEAMATGLPVVVTDITSNREWVTDGDNGYLAPAHSAEEFADRMLRVVGLAISERQVISVRNQQIIRERADWNKNFPKLLHLYQTVVGCVVMPT